MMKGEEKERKKARGGRGGTPPQKMLLFKYVHNSNVLKF
jgi:hypothetical protein